MLGGILTIALLLGGCFGSSGGAASTAPEEKKIEGFHAIATDEFYIQIPDGWDALKEVDFKSGTSKNVVAAFRSNVRSPKFTSNIVIVKNELGAESQASDYGKALRQKIIGELSALKELAVEEGSSTLFLSVEGRESDDADVKRFVEKSHVKGKTAYIAVGSFLASEDDGTAKKVETAVRSFEVK